MHLSTTILFLLTVIAVRAKQQFHASLPSEELKHYFGTEAREDVPDYEIVHPVHVSGSRHRRSLTSPKPPLQYHVTALGEEYHLHLRHNDELVAPGCLVTTVAGEEITAPCPLKENDCFYHGVSGSHPNSTVAVSTCKGLHGIISTPSHELIIQPIKEQHLSDVTGGYPVPAPPHIVYKVAARKKRSCGLQAAAENLVKSASRRMRRQAGRRYIEMLLVADKTMYAAHKDDLTRYMLTAANVASARFQDNSLGQKLYLAIINIRILKDDQSGLSIVPDADKTLTSFCKWQEKFNPANDNDPQHVDAASLMTQVDLVHMGVQSTTGLATLGGMCGKNIRCSVIQDDGLDIGLTLAHETGHSLSMHHDGEKNACSDRTNIMSTGGGGGPTAFKWSSCSRDFLNSFISKGDGDCLNDAPKGKTMDIPKDLPGVIYSGEDQCGFFVGPGSSLCTGTNLVDEFGGDECSKLICYDPSLPGTCKGSQIPRMDGTECGHRKWCQSGKCMDIGADGPKPQDGGWSAYTTDWTACSRTCGGGVRYKSRKCNKPRPLFGGKDCAGSDTLAELCNVQDCSTSQLAFKKEQCAATDSDPLMGQRLHWIPQETTDSAQCQLYCRPEGQGTLRMRTLHGSQNFIDGTECRATSGTYGRCVGGTCKAFGCDGVSDSGRDNDVCGVCSGNGDTCSKETGKFNKGEGHKYVSFKKLSKGSSGIVITNKNRYSTLSLSVGGTRIFNKQSGQRDRSGTYTLGGVTVKYRPTPEKLEVIGILSQDVEAEVYRVYGEDYGQAAEPDITYEYYVSKNPNAAKKFEWKTQDGQCSVTCGQGTVQTEAMCVMADSGTKVESYYCNLAEKPSSVGKSCSKPVCPASWRAGSFSACSKTCEGGTQTRSVECVRSGQKIPNGQCKGPKPESNQPCNTMVCPGEWRTLDWTTCSKTCSRGIQTRTVKCYMKNKEVDDSKCVPTDKPATSQTCLTDVCNKDLSGDKCADDSGCADYDTTVCSEYADWAKTNCMVKCGYCKGGSSTSAGGTCEDKSTECNDYGASACTEYKEWAEENCASFCGFCKQSGSAGTHCKDADPTTCKDYGIDACTKYPEWAKETCALSCNLCEGSGGAVTTPKTQTGGDCKDVSTDCVERGASVCTAYSEWSQENCAHFCNMCPGSSGIGSTGQAVDSTCKDESADCAGYDQKTCADYKEWAMKNCKKHCGLCEGKGATTPRETTTVARVVDANCEDKADCVSYGASVCTKYADWAVLNCKSHCHLCEGTQSAAVKSTTTTTSKPTTTKATTTATTTTTTKLSSKMSTVNVGVGEECTDLSDCNAYGASVCTQYAEWAVTNCRRHCGLCGGAGKAHTTEATATSTTESIDPNCKNVRADCEGYGKSACTQYADWAKQNCQKFCGFCGQETTPRAETTMSKAKTTFITVLSTKSMDPNCKDVRADCEGYGKSACTQYADWAKQNCQKFCGFCGQETTPRVAATTTKAKTTFIAVLSTKSMDPNCKDVRADCDGYGKSACTQYADWAKQNCQKFCGFCGQEATTQVSKTTPTTTISTANTDPNCKDVRADCVGYGKSACTQYADWAKQNCQKFCGFCGQEMTTEVAAATSTTKSPNSVHIDPNCKNVRADCEGYGKNACTQYGDWARQNCQKFCGFCGQDTTTTDPNCKDKQTDCAAYGTAACTKYPEWAASSCQKFCNLCGASESSGGGGGSVVASSETTPQTTDTVTSDNTCADKADCSGYGREACTKYKDWAQLNCQNYCGFCEGGSGSGVGSASGKGGTNGITETCTDKADCESYGKSVCTQYGDWAKQNCEKFCGICSSSVSDCQDASADCAGHGPTVCTEYADWSKQNCQKYCKLC